MEDEEDHLLLVSGTSIIDCSWDRGLEKYLPVNKWGKGMVPAVPIHKVYTPNESWQSFHDEPFEPLDEDYAGANLIFYHEFNAFLERTRRKR